MQAFNSINSRIKLFLSISLSDIDPLSMRSEIDSIGKAPVVDFRR